MNGGGTEPVGLRGKRMRQNGLHPIRRVEIELVHGVLSYFLCFFRAISVPAFLIYRYRYRTRGRGACSARARARALSCACRVWEFASGRWRGWRAGARAVDDRVQYTGL